MRQSYSGITTANKVALRRQAYAARKAQPHKAQISQWVCRRIVTLSEYKNANVVMWYLDSRSELRTRGAVSEALAIEKTIVIPYCDNYELHLWRLRNLDELVSGSYGILEPPKSRWNEGARQIDIEQLDMIIVPGVAFDRFGNRLGNGHGYYDRFLARLPPHTPIIAACFESQMFDNIPVDPHDIPIHKVVTEKCIYPTPHQQGS
jgi:5-formyltetrahydrofolate cyclo-ligase